MYLGLKSFEQVDLLYWTEYLLLMKAYALKELEKERDIHLLAYLTETARQKKRQGKQIVPMYKNFKEFYDYDKRRNRLISKKPAEHEQRIRDVIILANEL